MKILNTPNERFVDLPDFPFSPNYIEVEAGLNMHYIDEGPQDGEVVLLLHGQPSWSYLYRKMIPVFVENGYRVIAPDLIGFGKSGKPSEQSDYSYARHIQWLETFLQKTDLQGINLFVQDWGGLIGLRILAAHPHLFKTVTAGNTALPTGDQQMPDAFTQWVAFVKSVSYLPCGKILQSSTVSELSPEVMAAYDAPFPDASYQAGAKIFPSLVPATPNDPETENNRLAWQQLMQFDKPFLTLFSDSDPIMKGGEKVFQKLVPGAKHDQHTIIAAGGHFLQEDKGEEIARLMIDFIK
ncbi:MAG: haloalkane dehalogenase [Saprospiraceae bacterium]